MKFPYPLKNPPPLDLPLQDKTLLVVRSESTWIGFDKLEISLCQNCKGEFYLKGRPVREPRPYLNENPNAIREIRVSKRWVSGLFRRLENASIPAFPSPQVGADGGFTELEIGGYAGKAHYRWWSKPPRGWEVLHQIACEIPAKFHRRSLLSELIEKER